MKPNQTPRSIPLALFKIVGHFIELTPALANPANFKKIFEDLNSRPEGYQRGAISIYPSFIKQDPAFASEGNFQQVLQYSAYNESVNAIPSFLADNPELAKPSWLRRFVEAYSHSVGVYRWLRRIKTISHFAAANPENATAENLSLIFEDLRIVHSRTAGSYDFSGTQFFEQDKFINRTAREAMQAVSVFGQANRPEAFSEGNFDYLIREVLPKADTWTLFVPEKDRSLYPGDRAPLLPRRPDGEMGRFAAHAFSAALKVNPGFANEGNISRILKMLDGELYNFDDGDRLEAVFLVVSLFVKTNPALKVLIQPYREKLVEIHLRRFRGFSKALAQRGTQPLIEFVTLGAKIGAGQKEEKKIAPPTSDPNELARWIIEHRNPAEVEEIQISIGFDTGFLPSQEDRGKFISLFLFVASTYLKSFQALVPAPTRDPNAAYGLFIRGDVVAGKVKGQEQERRLDYIFNLSPEMNEKNLGHLLKQIQLLNLGLLAAGSEEAFQRFFPDEPLPGMDERLRAIAESYRNFERSYVLQLRKYDAYREPSAIYALDPVDHAERQQAFRQYRLEESLYPVHSWLVSLYTIDNSWDKLLPVLRTVEGMMLHQGRVEGKRVTRGQEFIQEIRLLGYKAAEEIDGFLKADSVPTVKRSPLDPFIGTAGPSDEEAARDYLQKMADALAAGTITADRLPDPDRFNQAAAYYGITLRRSELRKDDKTRTLLAPQVGRKETVPRREPVEVPTEVPEEKPLPAPAEPEPAPAEPTPPPAPIPTEPDPVPAGAGRSELRSAFGDLPTAEGKIKILSSEELAKGFETILENRGVYAKGIAFDRKRVLENYAHALRVRTSEGKQAVPSIARIYFPTSQIDLQETVAQQRPVMKKNLRLGAEDALEILRRIAKEGLFELVELHTYEEYRKAEDDLGVRPLDLINTLGADGYQALFISLMSGKALRDIWTTGLSEEDQRKIGKNAGKVVGALHNASLIVGDPHTWNLVVDERNEVFRIDMANVFHSDNYPSPEEFERDRQSEGFLIYEEIATMSSIARQAYRESYAREFKPLISESPDQASAPSGPKSSREVTAPGRPAEQSSDLPSLDSLNLNPDVRSQLLLLSFRDTSQLIDVSEQDLRFLGLSEQNIHEIKQALAAHNLKLRSEVRELTPAGHLERRKTIWAAVVVDEVLAGNTILVSVKRQASKIVVAAGPDQIADVLKAVAAHEAQSDAVKREQNRLIAAYNARFPNQTVTLGVIFPQEMSSPDLASVSDSLKRVHPDTLVVPRRLKFLDTLRRIGVQLRQVDFSRPSFMDYDALSVAVLDEDQKEPNLAGMYIPFTSREVNKVGDYLARAEVRFVQLLSTGVTSQLLKENPKLALNLSQLRAELLKVLGPMYAQAINTQGQGFDVNPLEIRVITEYLAQSEFRKAA